MTTLQKSKLEYFFSILDTSGNEVLQPDDFLNVADKISDKLRYGEKSKARLKLRLKSYRLFIQILADIGKEEESISIDEWLNFFDFFNFKQPDYINRYMIRISNYIFSLFDNNFDLHINRQEYKEMFEAYNINLEDASIGFDKLDENEDQFISKKELVQGCYDFFLSSDPNARGNWIFGNWNNRPQYKTAS